MGIITFIAHTRLESRVRKRRRVFNTINSRSRGSQYVAVEFRRREVAHIRFRRFVGAPS